MFKVILSIICLLSGYAVHEDFTQFDGGNDDPLLTLRQKSLESPFCGKDWQQQFKQLQSDIREDKLPLRYFIVAHGGQGANDRLTSIITGFYAALLSKRAFFLMSFNEAPEFQLAFDTPIINLSLNEVWRDKFRKHHYPSDVNFDNMVKLTFRDSQPLFHPSHDNSSLASIFGDTPIIWFNSNRGYSYHLINDSPYGKVLRDYGINPYYAFNCAFHYLFRPNKEVRVLASQFSESFKDSSVIKIGIQIRTGDHHMAYSQLLVNSSLYIENFFRCAQNLEKTRLKEEYSTNKVVWYLISDSLSLKQDAKRLYGNKIITNTAQKPEHSGSGGREKGGRALQLLFSEQLTLSLCDFYIISHDSHVGRLAVWMSAFGASRNNTYIGHERKVGANPSHNEICQHLGPDYLTADRGAGI